MIVNRQALASSDSVDRIPAQSLRSSRPEIEPSISGTHHADESIAALQIMLTDRDQLIERQAGIILARTQQLDVVCEELTRMVHQLDKLHAVLEANEERWQKLDQTVTKYRGWLTGYDANLVYLQNQIEQRDQLIRELTAKIDRD